MTKGAVEAATKGLAGSRTAQITMAYEELVYVITYRNRKFWNNLR